MNIPQKEQKIWDALEHEGFPTYLVGGAVRDIVLGGEPKDFDLATLARPNQIKEVIRMHLPDAKINFVGASFGVVLVDGVEVATFRGDRYEGNGDDKAVEIQYVDSIEEDLGRRDFSFNAMALNIDDEIIDPYNGVNDLNNDIIRFVGDPDERIKEDAHRILRLCRFMAKGDFIIDNETYNAVRRNLHLVYKIAPERIRAEILKAMSYKNASAFWGALHTFGALEIILPELGDSWNHVGGEWHIESVWDHSMLAGDHVSTKFPLVKLAAYLHDIGKPAAYRKQKDGSFINHELIGDNILRRRLFALKFSSKEINKVASLVKFHMRQLIDISPKAQRKLLKDLNEFNLNFTDLIRLRIADKAANLRSSQFKFDRIRKMVHACTFEEEVVFSTHSLSVSGGQLISEFELEPGPEVGKLQKLLLEYSLEVGTNDPDCLLIKAHEVLKE